MECQAVNGFSNITVPLKDFIANNSQDIITVAPFSELNGLVNKTKQIIKSDKFENKNYPIPPENPDELNLNISKTEDSNDTPTIDEESMKDIENAKYVIISSIKLKDWIQIERIVYLVL